MRRIFDPKGFIFAVPMDHGYTLGPIKGVNNIEDTTKKVIQGGASCIIVQKGMVRRISSHIPSSKALLIHISGSTSLSPEPNYKMLTGSVTNSIYLGADGVSTHVNVGSKNDSQMLFDLSNIVEDASLYGLPVLAMMYARNDDGIDYTDAETLSQISRLAEETGVDIVKINSTPGGKGFDEVTQGVKIPIVIAGGSKTNDFNDFLSTIEQCIIQGASGVSIGRNVFQADDPKKAMKLVRDTVLKAKKETE